VNVKLKLTTIITIWFVLFSIFLLYIYTFQSLGVRIFYFLKKLIQFGLFVLMKRLISV